MISFLSLPKQFRCCSACLYLSYVNVDFSIYKVRLSTNLVSIKVADLSSSRSVGIRAIQLFFVTLHRIYKLEHLNISTLSKRWMNSKCVYDPGVFQMYTHTFIFNARPIFLLCVGVSDA